MAAANYTAAAYAKRWPIAALALTLGTEAVIYAVIPEERVQGELLFSLFVIVGTWLAGDAVRARLVHADREVRSALDLVDGQTAHAVAEERALIARELHDVIAHSVSVMGMQAGAARTLLDGGNIVASREAILAIETTARSSVAELQRLLSIREAE